MASSAELSIYDHSRDSRPSSPSCWNVSLNLTLPTESADAFYCVRAYVLPKHGGEIGFDATITSVLDMDREFEYVLREVSEEQLRLHVARAGKDWRVHVIARLIGKFVREQGEP